MFSVPRPVSPKSALSDFITYFKEPRQHKWLVLILSMAMTGVLIWAFITDAKTNTTMGPTITYVTSIPPDRSDADIIAQQMIDYDKREAALAKKRREFQTVADMSGIDWRKEEAIAAKKRAAFDAEVRAIMKERLRRAKAEQAAKAEAGQ